MSVMVIHAQRMVLYVQTHLALSHAVVLKNSITMETNVMVYNVQTAIKKR